LFYRDSQVTILCLLHSGFCHSSQLECSPISLCLSKFYPFPVKF
jgi:hypothetical protein